MNDLKKPFILLDVDDTILDFHADEAIALTRTLEEQGVEVTPERIKRYSEINQSMWELLEEGKITRMEVLVRRFELFFKELGFERSGFETQAMYEHYLSLGHHFMPQAEELLENLYGRYPLYIVSNGTGVVQDGRIASSGIARYFEKIFISERVGANKPSLEFFEKCFAEIDGFEKDRSIIIGDSLTSDIRGGINCGIKTCWYNPNGKAARSDINADYEIRELMELPALIEKVFPGC